MTPIDPKPAAGLLAGAITTFLLGLASRYTDYQATIEEAGAIVTIVSFGLAWLVPNQWFSRSAANMTEVNAAASQPHEPSA